MKLHEYEINNIKIIIYENEKSFVTVHLFTLCGMEKDKCYINGITHLSEHLLLKQKNIFNYFNFQNAYVEKEFTSFYGIVFKQNFKSFFNTFIQLYSNFNVDLITLNKEKNIIKNYENVRVMNDCNIMDINFIENEILNENERYEYTINETFDNITLKHVYEYVYNEHIPAKKYLIISGNNLDHKDIIMSVKKSLTYNCNITLGNKLSKENISKNEMKTISQYNPKQKIFTIKYDNHDIKDFFKAKILCLIYKMFLKQNGNSKNRINDIIIKNYKNFIVIYLVYIKADVNPIKQLKDLSIDFIQTIFDEVKKQLILNYINISCNCIEFNKLLFKFLYYYNKTLNLDEIYLQIKSIDINEIYSFHNKLLVIA